MNADLKPSRSTIPRRYTEQAAKAVGTPLSTLYRWAKDAPFRSRRPNTTRKTTWTTELVQAVEEWRLEEPTWGKAKIVVKLREQGFTVSEATVGRILKVDAIQVDGGSEFMAEFEDACRQRAIKLYLLPPKSPEINGAVERCNSSWRYEFYAVYDLPTRLDDLNPLIDAFQHRYNTYRPHAALGGKTPAQYLATRQANETPVSHMS